MNGPYRITKDMIGYDYQMKLPFIYDVYTKNLSFIQTSKDLANLGVKNNKFFLKLYDKELLGVNPYSPSITQEQIKRIIIECVRNPWYYLRELARIPASGRLSCRQCRGCSRGSSRHAWYRYWGCPCRFAPKRWRM